MSEAARLLTAEELFDSPDSRSYELVRGVPRVCEPLGGLHGRLAGKIAAVEIVSPNSRWSEVEETVEDYLDGGTRLVWVVDPGERRVVVRYPDRPPRVLAPGDVLDGEGVVPGFALALADLFGKYRTPGDVID